MISKDQMVDDLYKFLTSEPQTNRFYWNKSVGFKSEVEFSRLCESLEFSTLDGGMFLFKKTFPHHALYATVSRDNKEDYTEFYKQLSSSSIVKNMFFVQFTGWDDKPIQIEMKTGTTANLDEKTLGESRILLKNPKDVPKQKKVKVDVHSPKFDFFEFKDDSWYACSLDYIRSLFGTTRSQRVGAKKNSFVDYLLEYSEDEISNIYCDRFFFDVLLGGVDKGMSDIDKIIVQDDKYILVEVKNKTPFYAENSPDDLSKATFGWDTRRLAWYLFLKNDTGLDTRFVVAHIDDKINRKILKWKSITMNHWCNCSSWGSDTGDTQMAPYNEFSDLQ